MFLHPTSLPSPFGIGDLGEWAYRWIDMLVAMKQGYWQICPLGPTGYGDSPYQSLSSFAGNTLLISPESLQTAGLLLKKELQAYPALPDNRVDFGAVIAAKRKLFEAAYARFKKDASFRAFCKNENFWLDDYALFMTIKEMRQGKPWSLWEASLRLRFGASLEEVKESSQDRIDYHKFLQYCFFTQWDSLHAYAKRKDIKIVGDIPFYVAYDSADAWATPDAFEFDECGNPTRVAGVPPDYFSETGQLWGNPIYRWDWLRQQDYHWWLQRIRAALRIADCVRIDHFRAFDAFWAVPAEHETALNGKWVHGPGIRFFNTIRKALGELPLIAEDLGDITPSVETLRKDTGLPGMKVLQFAFDGNPENPYLPYNVSPDSVMYTGTHDNNTSAGWYANLSPEEKQRVNAYLGCGEKDFIVEFMRAAFASTADLCITPFQDILALGREHRMNTPGTGDQNWQWRFTKVMLDPNKTKRVADFADIYGRA